MPVTKKFYEEQNATANIIDGGHLSSNSLNGTNLLWRASWFFATGDGYISQAVAALGGNKLTGKTPDTEVSLPLIDGFKLNNNKNPQISDMSGAYGFMVFPTTKMYPIE